MTPRGALSTGGQVETHRGALSAGGNVVARGALSTGGKGGQLGAAAWHSCGTYGGADLERENQTLCDGCVVTNVSYARHNCNVNC